MFYLLKLLGIGALLGWSVIEIIKSIQKKGLIQHQIIKSQAQEALKRHMAQIRASGRYSSGVKYLAFEAVCAYVLEKPFYVTSDVEQLVSDLFKQFDNGNTICKTNFPKNSTVKLSPDCLFYIAMIAVEGISNTMQHSNATYLTVILAPKEKEIQLVIHDTGVGFDKNSVEYAGLHHIENYVSLIGGTMNLTSPQGAGTVLNIHFTVSNN